ncbi:MAG: DNA mismatch repair protein MutL, partial [Dehalococcoidia bacterium]|nr:DNA mismatch repair protein MutL [Dehalococcoidia bacterium]
LFHYFPARLKFLKSANTETAHTAYLLTQYALAYPEVRFSLLIGRHTSLQTTGTGDLREVAGQTYGPELAQRMLELKGGDTIIKVRGLASPPSLTRADRRYLSFFVNRRWVRSPLLLRATEQAYHGLLMDGKHPIVIIDLSLPPSEVDVNVHPTKAELKFCRDQAVFASVEQAIRGALARTAVATPMGTSLPAASEQQQSAFMIKEQQPGFAAPLPAPGLPALRVMGQLATTYIIAEGPEGLYLIDQHAAHERILYEKILSQWERQELEIQGLLQPATMELSPRQEQILQSNGETLARLGFTIEPFGNRSYLVRAVPAVVAGTDVVQGVTTLLDTLASLENAAPREEKMAESLACHSAIRAGQRLSNEEMAELIRQLEQARQPRSCPHGRPTMIHLSS